MRRILAVAAAVGLWVTLAGCTPTVTLTATPSTTKPACGAVTTVTGKLTPADAVLVLDLEYQRPDGRWVALRWFETDEPGEGWHDIRATPDSKGGYKTSYLAPNMTLPNPLRLRMHALRKSQGIDAVSKSWYVTRPSC